MRVASRLLDHKRLLSLVLESQLRNLVDGRVRIEGLVLIERGLFESLAQIIVEVPVRL